MTDLQSKPSKTDPKDPAFKYTAFIVAGVAFSESDKQWFLVLVAVVTYAAIYGFQRYTNRR